MICISKSILLGILVQEFSKYVLASDQLTEGQFVIMAILKLRYVVYTGAYDFYNGIVTSSIRHFVME